MLSAQGLNRAVAMLERISHGIGMFAVMVVMLIVCSDTLMRYLVNAPLQWAYDVISLYFMLMIAYLPLSATFTAGQHVNVTLFYLLLPKASRKVVDAVVSLLIMGFCLLVTYPALVKSWQSFVRGDVQLGYTAFPMWLSYLPIAAGFVVFFCRIGLSVVMWVSSGRDPFVTREGMVE